MGILITAKTRENANSNMADRKSCRQDCRRAISLLQEATRLIAEEYELLHDYRDLFIDKAVRNNRSKLAIANRHQER